MKRVQLISALLLLAIVTSCVKEIYTNCPDYGKYKVLFYNKRGSAVRGEMNGAILYRDNTGLSDENGTYECLLKEDSSTILTDRRVRLFPGEYRFCSIIRTTESKNIMDIVKMKNRDLHMFADEVDRIIKSGENRVVFEYRIVNSVIEARCTLDESFSEEYYIYDLEISAPDDTDILLDMESGVCNYSTRITEFYDHFRYVEERDIFEYFCVPLISGNFLNFRITIKREQTGDIREVSDDIILKTRLYLISNIEQGKITRFSFNVTPHEIKYLSTTVEDWKDYDDDEEDISLT